MSIETEKINNINEPEDPEQINEIINSVKKAIKRFSPLQDDINKNLERMMREYAVFGFKARALISDSSARTDIIKILEMLEKSVMETKELAKVATEKSEEAFGHIDIIFDKTHAYIQDSKTLLAELKKVLVDNDVYIRK